ncbi:MAG TPA: GspH/FimT family pseudopilin [Thermoanaerobaculia bacterium]|nr:GspH/FimT family pseudopilin [Thermoanaerobaculia bacterium]
MVDIQKRSSDSQRGYSLSEALVVIAIIGMVSLVTVPNFISLYRAGKIKSASRQFANDLRSLRQHAVSKNVRTMISIGTTDAEKYQYWLFQESGGAWEPVAPGVRDLEPAGAGTRSVYFGASGFADTITDDAADRNDIIFLSNGTVVPYPADPTVVIRTDGKIAKPAYTFTISRAGSVRTTSD